MESLSVKVEGSVQRLETLNEFSQTIESKQTDEDVSMTEPSLL
jgi:hypothetical protein